MQYTNKHNIPELYKQAIIAGSEEYSRGESDISTTGLIDSLLIHILKEKHKDELVIDVTDLFFSFWGTVAHGVIERIPDKSIIFRERRLYVTINDVVVSGCPDIYYTSNKSKKVLNDFKTPSKKALEKGVKVEYEKQINVYKFILEENGYPVDKLELTAFIRDARSYENKFMHFAVKQYKHHKIREYLEKRIALYKLYKSGLLARIPECTPAERWRRDTSYSIMKKGNKKQTGKTFDDLIEAQRILALLQQKHPKNEYEIVTKHGTNVRCEGWCEVNRFCWWWNMPEDQRPDTHNEVVEGAVLNDMSKTADQMFKEWKEGKNTNG